MSQDAPTVPQQLPFDTGPVDVLLVFQLIQVFLLSDHLLFFLNDFVHLVLTEPQKSDSGRCGINKDNLFYSTVKTKNK